MGKEASFELDFYILAVSLVLVMIPNAVGMISNDSDYVIHEQLMKTIDKIEHAELKDFIYLLVAGFIQEL